MATISFLTYVDINQRKFRIQDTSSYSIQGILLSNIKGVIKITTPRGITYNNTNYSSPDVTPSTSLYSGYIALPTNAQGYVLAGAYTVQYSVLNSSDSSISTVSNSYTYSFIVPAISISQVVDGYNSIFISTDNTSYGSYSSLVSTHEVTPPSGSPLSIVSNSNQAITYSPNIWSGIWTSQITSVLVYIESDGLIINASLTATETITAYLNDMNVIRGYIETFKQLFDTSRATNKELAYRIQISLTKIDTSYTEYDLALYYNDLATAYLRTVDIITELSDYITITFPEEIIPFVNSQGGSSHSPVSISSPALGVSINSSQVLSFSLATISSGGMAPILSGSYTDYLGGDGSYHSLTSGTYALKSDFINYIGVTAITATNITNWQTAYGWGNHASAGYALSANVYTKTELQISGSSLVHWGNVTNKPTTLAGYGITDGMQGNVAITGAIHTKITYDSKGLVIGGVDLVASDIPNLSWSKITSGTPTTLSGYGITDAYTKTQVDNKTWDFTTSITGTPTTLSGYGITDAYTKTQVDNKTWDFTTSITGTPTTLSGYGITDALSTSSPAASVINTGLGTMYLSDDGTYKVIDSTVYGSDTQLIYNNAGVYAGSSSMTFDGILTYIDTLRVISTLQFGDSTANIHKGAGGDLTFYDSVVATAYTLAELVGTATNFWTPSGSNIWYGYKVGIGGIGTMTETLEVTGSILADNFSTKYFRYTTGGNLLIGPNAGDLETGTGKLYIHNTNSSTPIIYGDLGSLDLTFGGNVTIANAKAFIFGTSTVEVYTDISNNLIFKDALADSGAAITLSNLRDGAYYSLVSAYTDYIAVTSITAANKVIWNKASYITITGDGTKYLSDNGVYNTITGSITVTDNILKWDTSTFRPYTTKSEAGGASSNGKLYRDAIDLPTATTQLVYDGNYYATNLFLTNDITTSVLKTSGGTKTNGYFYTGTTNPSNTTRLNYDGWFYATGLQCYEGVYATLTSSSSSSRAAYLSKTYAVDSTVSTVAINRLSITGLNITGALLELIDNLTSPATFGSVISGVVNTVERFYLNPRSTSLAYKYDTSSTLTSGSLAQFYNNSSLKFDIQYDGSINIPTGANYKINDVVIGNTFSNGLYEDGGAVVWGGDLTQNTTVTGAYTIYMMPTSGNTFTIGSDNSGTWGTKQSFVMFGSNVNEPAITFTIMDSQVMPVSTSVTLTTSGLAYIADYSSYFTDRTLVDRGYVVGYAEPVLGNPGTDGYVLSSTVAGVRSWIANGGGGVTPVSDILYWNSGTSKYTPYAASTIGCLDSSSTDPTDTTTRLNYNGLFSATRIVLNSLPSNAITINNGTSNGISIVVSSSNGIFATATTGTAIYGQSTTTGSAIKADISSLLSSNCSAKLIDLQRTGIHTYNITGDIISISDNPTTSGTISGSVLKATIGTTVRINMNPRVVDSSSAIAYKFDTVNTLSTSGAKIASYINNGTEKAYITYKGSEALTAGTSSTFIMVPGIIKDFYTDVSTSGTSETDLYSYTVPANTLTTNGDKLKVKFVIEGTSTAASAIIYFAGISCFTSGANDYTGYSYVIDVLLIRVSSSIVRISVEGKSSAGNEQTYSELTSLDLTTTNIFKLAGLANNNSITAKLGTIEYQPSGVN